MNKSLLILLIFIALINKVSAQPFFYDGWYGFWDSFWYGSYPYGYFEMSWGFFLLVTSLLTVIIGFGLQKTPIFKDSDKKKLAILVAAIISIIVTSVSPFAFWLKELLYFSAWILTLLLTILILIIAWSILHIGWEKGSEERAKATQSAAVASAGKEEARKIEHEKKIERRLKREELKELEKIRKAANKENIRGLTTGIDELEDLLRSEHRIVAKANKAADEATRKLGMIIPYFKEDNRHGWNQRWIPEITSQEMSAFSEIDTIKGNIVALASDIESKFGAIWTEYKSLERIAEKDMDKTNTIVKAMKSDVRKIHANEKRIEDFESKFNNTFIKVKRLLINRTPPVHI